MRTHIRPVFLGLAGCGLAAFATAPAAARSCPAGQFLQVSKGKCISKASAQKLGIARRAPTRTAHAAVGPASRKAAPDDAERAGRTEVPRTAPEQKTVETAKVETLPQAGADAPGETTVASVGTGNTPLGYAGAPAETPTVRRNIAPFGALQFGGLR